MFSTEFNKNYNLMTIRLRDNFDEIQGDLLYQRLATEFSKTQKGFMVLTDLGDLDILNKVAYPHIQKMMSLCNSHNVSKIFRVIPDKTKDIGFNIMSAFNYSKNVSIQTFKSMEEAQYSIKLNTNITLINKIITILKIIKLKLLALSQHTSFRLTVIIGGFIVLIILRQAFKAFGIALNYIYITLIALAGLWFEIKGGLIAAVIALIIFLIEVAIFSSWSSRGFVLKTILLRIFIYFFSGILIGWQSSLEKKLRKKLEFLASHDELTGILNFRSSLSLIRKEFERTKRHNNNLVIAILDIDHFKQINDTYGHLVGNDAIKKFSDIIKNTLRETDTIGRYGGDEFVLILPESNKEQGLKILNRIMALIDSTKITSSFLINKKTFLLTFSAGLASFSAQDKTINDLINRADKALYQAKEEGRNRIICQ